MCVYVCACMRVAILYKIILPNCICLPKATATGGRIVLVGFGPTEVKLPLIRAQCREIDIFGMTTFANS